VWALNIVARVSGRVELMLLAATAVLPGICANSWSPTCHRS
jgi:hypothetical protein